MKNSYFLKLKLDQIHRIGSVVTLGGTCKRIFTRNELSYVAIVSRIDCIRSTGDFGHTDIIFSYSPLIHHRSTSASTQNRTSIERATDGMHNENSPEVHEKIILNMRWAKF